MKESVIRENDIERIRISISNDFIGTVSRIRDKRSKLGFISVEKVAQEISNLKDRVDSYFPNAQRLVDISDENERPKKKECEHKWRDYNWYLEYEGKQFPNGNKTFNYTIYEPYVCIYCHKRNTVELENGIIDIRNKTMNDAVRELYQKYPKIKSRALIEDEINDDIYVDREYLKWADFLSGRNEKLEKDGQIKLKLRINEETEANDIVVVGKDGREEDNGEKVQGA